MKFLQKNNFLILIILLAAVLRFTGITFNPPSLNWDEVSHGYNAYSILKTGRDEWGKSFPTIFRAYGDYKLPSYIYLTAVSEAIFGLNAFAVRLPSVLAGIATVLFTYLLAKELFGKRIALVASLLIAVEPWSLFLSRAAFEANLALFLFISGTYFFFKGFSRTTYYLLPATFLLGLTVWTYNSYRIFTPLMIVVLLVTFRKKLKSIYKKSHTTCYLLLATLLAFLVPMFWQLINPSGQVRYEWVAIIDQGAVNQINEARVNSDLPGFMPVLLHNKATYFTKSFISNYFSHFSPKFLFFKGGSHYQFSVPGYGLLYWLNLPFFLIGLFDLGKQIRFSKSAKLLFFWLFLAPIPSSLTREAPHVLRAITMLPIPMIISAYGLVSFSAWLKSRLHTTYYILLASYLIVLAGFAEDYLGTYFTKYRTDYSWAWQYGYKQVIQYTKEHGKNYDKIIVTKKYGEPHEFFLFYWPWDPQKYQHDCSLIRFYQSKWYWVDGFDKFYFINDWEIPEEGKIFILESGLGVDCVAEDDCLLITSPNNYPKGWRKIKTINFLDDQPAFEIYDHKKI
jgi:4-amino-4-deoxy-L-arabinose transferase-like glycosyltransferase